MAQDGLTGIRVLLLEGFARQSLPVIKALHFSGCHVTTYNQKKTDVGYVTRFADEKIIAPWDRDDEDFSTKALFEVLQKGQYDVVIPTTDFSALILARNKQTISQYAAPAVADWDTFIIARDKLLTMIACMDNGIPCPKTLRNAESAEEIIQSGMQYPLVIKPRSSYGAIGFHCVQNNEQLTTAFDNATKMCGEVLAQEYIRQTNVQYQCEMLIDNDGNVKSAVVIKKVRWYPVDGGSTCCGITVDKPDIIENCARLLKVIGWTGYADIDLIEDPRDNIAKIMEINPRLTASVKICFAAGVDFARQIVELALGREVTDYTDYQKGCCLRYLHTDLLWFIKSPLRFRAKPSWFNWKNTTDEIWDPSDVLPWVTYTIQGLAKFRTESQKRKR